MFWQFLTVYGVSPMHWTLPMILRSLAVQHPDEELCQVEHIQPGWDLLKAIPHDVGTESCIAYRFARRCQASSSFEMSESKVY